MIAGAPQYHLGSYLDKENTKVNLEYILNGNITNEGKAILDERLARNIINSRIKPDKIFLHYSNQEHTYTEHIIDLIKDLKQVNVPIEENVADYSVHSDVSKYYPSYLVETLKSLGIR